MSLFEELKRRSVFRVAAAYVVASWVLIEGGSLILEILGAPDLVMRIVVVLLALAFPFVLAFTWAFVVTPDGIKRESDLEPEQVLHGSDRRLNQVTIAMIIVGIGVLAYDRFLFQADREQSASSVELSAPNQAEQATRKVLEIDRLRVRGEYASAFELATEVAPLLPDGVDQESLWDRISWSTDITSDPTGAQVWRQPLESEEDWDLLGVTPLQNVRFAEGQGYRLRFELDGYRTVEILHTALVGVKWRGAPSIQPVTLDPVDALPEEMVRIPGFTRDLVDFADYFMDRFEVTNADYEKFVQAGGYSDQRYWTDEYERDGKTVVWEEAVQKFVDRTGRPGPGTWQGGVYPDGQDEFPVGGVSWYEASAYARFVGKELPTCEHQRRALPFYRENSAIIASRSNLQGDGPRPVGQNRAMSTLGIYDMIGNVREWCRNEAGPGQRGTRGGGWMEPPYMANWVHPKSAWDREPSLGFRLAKTFDDDQRLARLLEPVSPPARRDYRDDVPVSDSEFEIYRRMYTYDPSPLNAEVQEVVEFKHWRRETVAFDLPYGERGGAIVYVPKSSQRPFQAIVYWGGSGLLNQRSADEEWLQPFDFLVRAGRVVALPIFKGAYHRDDDEFSITHEKLLNKTETREFRDIQIRWVQDVSRTVDYLESREDINPNALGYYGWSFGGMSAPFVLTIDNRFKAAVLNAGGFWDAHYLPEADAINFVSRVKTPVLALNGEYDVVFPLETSLLPMFEMLGTAPENKKLYLVPSDHIVPQDELIRETLGWFDRYLTGESNE